MTFHVRLASTPPAVAVFLWLAAASIARAQDVMELDLAFKNSVPQAHAPEAHDERREVRGRRSRARDAQGLVAEEKRLGRRRRAEER